MFGLLTVVLVIVALGHSLLKYWFNYWNRRGVFQLSPTAPFGDFGPVIRQQQSTADFYRDLYNRTKQYPLVGIYLLFRPVLMINDAQLMRNIMTQDFQHFHDRGVHVDEERDPLSGHLFALAGEKWHQLRMSLAPAFTPSKLKEMFHIQLATAETLQKYVDQFAVSGKVIEMRDLFSRYAIDAIASVIFGIEVNSIHNPSEEFYVIGRKCLQSNVANFLRWTMSILVPGVMKYTRIKLFDQELEDFMMSVVRQTVEYREKHNFCRKDIVQALLQLRNRGKVSRDSWEVDSSTKEKNLSMNELTAVIFTFFMAGYDTSSSAMTFCVYELAKNQDLQRKAQDEIDQILIQSNGVVTYDGIVNMQYLGQCIDETVRKYPPLSFLSRICTKDYPVPGANYTIREGTSILLPIYGLQSDPSFYPNPDEFRPERFVKSEVTSGMPYYPFGEGPRQCIGMRMSKIKTRTALALMLAKYNIRLADPGKEVSIDPQHFTINPKGGIRVIVTRRNATIQVAKQ